MNSQIPPIHQDGRAAFLGVDYEEFKPETYHCVFVREQDGEGGESNRPFNSGNFDKYLADARAYLDKLEGIKYELSSVHNFLGDLSSNAS